MWALYAVIAVTLIAIMYAAWLGISHENGDKKKARKS